MPRWARGSRLSLIFNKSRVAYIERPAATPPETHSGEIHDRASSSWKTRGAAAARRSSLTEISTLCTNFKGAPWLLLLPPFPCLFPYSLLFLSLSLFLFPFRTSFPLPRELLLCSSRKVFGIIYPEPVQFRNTNLHRLRGSDWASSGPPKLHVNFISGARSSLLLFYFLLFACFPRFLRNGRGKEIRCARGWTTITGTGVDKRDFVESVGVQAQFSFRRLTLGSYRQVDQTQVCIRLKIIYKSNESMIIWQSQSFDLSSIKNFGTILQNFWIFSLSRPFPYPITFEISFPIVYIWYAWLNQQYIHSKR